MPVTRGVNSFDLRLLFAIARHGSFRKAAVELGVTPSGLSHGLRTLEKRVGVRLVDRSTRSVALTSAGERLRERVEPALLDIDVALEQLRATREKPSGSLRINATVQGGRLALLPTLTRFLQAYPEIEVEVVGDDSVTIDLVKGKFDAGVRIGERVAQSMVALPLGPRQRMAVVGSPVFFERYAKPRNPRDLRDLPCIRYRLHEGAIYEWEFEKRGKELRIAVRGTLTLGSQELMVEAARSGAGLAYVFEHRAAEEIARGHLVRVLGDWCEPFPGFFLYYLRRRQHSVAFRALLNFIRSEGGPSSS